MEASTGPGQVGIGGVESELDFEHPGNFGACMGKRAAYLHEELVHRIRHLLVHMRSSSSVSDDTDMWYVRQFGYSPMLQIGEGNAASIAEADRAAKRLVRLGAEAADAVALGLRMQGTWRTLLLPFARKHRGEEAVRLALELVAQRTRDPLAVQARRIVARAGKQE